MAAVIVLICASNKFFSMYTMIIGKSVTNGIAIKKPSVAQRAENPIPTPNWRTRNPIMTKLVIKTPRMNTEIAMKMFSPMPRKPKMIKLKNEVTITNIVNTTAMIGSPVMIMNPMNQAANYTKIRNSSNVVKVVTIIVVMEKGMKNDRNNIVKVNGAQNQRLGMKFQSHSNGMLTM